MWLATGRESLAIILPTLEQRRIAVDVVRQVLLIAPEDIRVDRPLCRKLSDVLEMSLGEMPNSADLAAV